MGTAQTRRGVTAIGVSVVSLAIVSLVAGSLQPVEPTGSTPDLAAPPATRAVEIAPVSRADEIVIDTLASNRFEYGPVPVRTLVAPSV